MEVMASRIEVDENRIDRPSQVMLGTLAETDGWVYGSRLRDAADVAENTQVFYRMEEYLLPAGLVEEREREPREEARQQPRQFRLTHAGAEWVDDHADEIAQPATREEVQELAREGYDAATSAKESVQNYRKKLHRVKEQVEEVQDLQEQVEDVESQTGYQQGAISGIRQRSLKNEDNHEEFADEIREIVERQREEIDTLQQTNSALQQRLQTVEQKQQQAIRQQALYERSQLPQPTKPAGYGVLGAVAMYLLVLVIVYLLAPQLLMSVLLGGVALVVAVAVGTGLTLYTRRETSQVS
jgi:chromosome segregation ATPase